MELPDGWKPRETEISTDGHRHLPPPGSQYGAEPTEIAAQKAALSRDLGAPPPQKGLHSRT